MENQRKILVKDGAMVNTETVSSTSFREDWLNDFLKPMTKNCSDMIVGLDTEWSMQQSSDPDKKEAKVVLLKLYSHSTCLLIGLDNSTLVEDLSKLLVNKDIIFAGINMERDLEMLRNQYGLEIRTFVELSELAAIALHHPLTHRSAYNVRGLASELLAQVLKPRPLCVITSDWSASTLTEEQIEHATIDAYFTNKIAKKLLTCKR